MDGYQRRLERFRARKAKAAVIKDSQSAKTIVDEELQQLRDRGKELGIPRASQMGKDKLLAAIAEKEEGGGEGNAGS